MPSDSRRIRALLLGLATAIVLFDQLTKWLIERSLSLHDSFVVIPGLFQIVHVQNKGAAFGIFADSTHELRTLFLVLFSIVALAVVLWLLWHNSIHLNVTACGLASILGGAIGNLIDRVRYGHVTDFLYFHWGPHYWPAFNVADSAIVIGASLLMLEVLFPRFFARRSVREHARKPFEA